jgi:cell division inhibitor SepF
MEGKKMKSLKKLGRYLGLVDEVDVDNDPEGRYDILLKSRNNPNVSSSRTSPTRSTAPDEGVRLIPSSDREPESGRVINLPTHMQDSDEADSVEVSRQIKMVSPMVFNDAEKIGIDFRNGHPVMINLTEADAELQRRLIDFLSGTVLALGGKMQKASKGVILIVPNGYQISSMQQDEITSGHFFNQG